MSKLVHALALVVLTFGGSAPAVGKSKAKKADPSPVSVKCKDIYTGGGGKSCSFTPALTGPYKITTLHTVTGAKNATISSVLKINGAIYCELTSSPKTENGGFTMSRSIKLTQSVPVVIEATGTTQGPVTGKTIKILPIYAATAETECTGF